MAAADLDVYLRDLSHFEWMVRMEAVRKLELLQAESAVDELADHVLHDENQHVRAAAARALGKIGSGRAVDALIGALDDEAFHVRQAAIWALGEVGAPAEKALPALQLLTQSPERYGQVELTEAEVAAMVVARIESEVEEAAEARRKAEEARAQAEAAKQAAAQAPQAEAAAPAAEAAATEAVAEAPAAEAAAPAGGLSAQDRQEMRRAALARHKEILEKMRAAGINI